jgi:hypothetical protein
MPRGEKPARENDQTRVRLPPLIPAQAGIQPKAKFWIPACAGMSGLPVVMAGLVPAIHESGSAKKAWMPGTRPGLTMERGKNA